MYACVYYFLVTNGFATLLHMCEVLCTTIHQQLNNGGTVHGPLGAAMHINIGVWAMDLAFINTTRAISLFVRRIIV